MIHTFLVGMKNGQKIGPENSFLAALELRKKELEEIGEKLAAEHSLLTLLIDALKRGEAPSSFAKVPEENIDDPGPKKPLAETKSPRSKIPKRRKRIKK